MKEEERARTWGRRVGGEVEVEVCGGGRTAGCDGNCGSVVEHTKRWGSAVATDASSPLESATLLSLGSGTVNKQEQFMPLQTVPPK